MPGYPDFQSITQWRGAPLYDASTTWPTGSNQVFKANTSSYASMYITANLTAGECSVQVQHWANSTDAAPLRVDIWLLTTVTHLDVQIPLLGNVTEIDIIVPAAQTATLGMAAVPSNVPVVSASYGWVNNFRAKGTTAVPASGTITWGFDKIRPGQVQFYFNPSDSTGMLIPKIVEQNASGGVGSTVFAISPPTVTTTYTVAVPDQPWLAAIVNNSPTNPHSFSGGLTYYGAG